MLAIAHREAGVPEARGKGDTDGRGRRVFLGHDEWITIMNHVVRMSGDPTTQDEWEAAKIAANRIFLLLMASASGMRDNELNADLLVETDGTSIPLDNLRSSAHLANIEHNAIDKYNPSTWIALLTQGQASKYEKLSRAGQSNQAHEVIRERIMHMEEFLETMEVDNECMHQISSLKEYARFDEKSSRQR